MIVIFFPGVNMDIHGRLNKEISNSSSSYTILNRVTLCFPLKRMTRALETMTPSTAIRSSFFHVSLESSSILS